MDEPVKVKICGITRREDALWAARCGADFLGLVFAESPRRVGYEQARRILDGFPYPVTWVGVFKDDPVEEVVEVARGLGLGWVQLHGREDLRCVQTLQGKFRVLKAFEVQRETSAEELEDYPGEYILLDRPKDSNKGWDYGKASRIAAHKKVFLAGNLRPETVEEIATKVRPFAVDVSRGVECSAGIKDPQKVEAFIRVAKHATLKAVLQT